MKRLLLGAAVICAALASGVTHMAPGAARAAAGCHSIPSRGAGKVVGRVGFISGGARHSVSYVQGTDNDGAIPGDHPVHYFCTGLPCHPNLMNGVKTVVISGHHFTHPLPGQAHGAFYELGLLQKGSVITASCERPFGTGTNKYVVTRNISVYCGPTTADFLYCPPAVHVLNQIGWTQNRFDGVTCIGDGHYRQIVTGLAESKKQKRN